MSVAQIEKKNNATVTDRRYKEYVFKGTFTALVTPFRNGDVDLAAPSVIPSGVEESLTANRKIIRDVSTSLDMTTD